MRRRVVSAATPRLRLPWHTTALAHRPHDLRDAYGGNPQQGGRTSGGAAPCGPRGLARPRTDVAGRASVLVSVGLFLVYKAKSAPLAEVDQQLAAKKLLNLNELGAREELLPALGVIPNQREREEAARKIYYLTGGLPNVGRIRSGMTGEQFRQLKPLFVVRQPGAVPRALPALVRLLFFARSGWRTPGGACAASAATRRFCRRLLLLSGIGLILMVSLRDPVRDNLLFVDFAQGVVRRLRAAGRAQRRSITSGSSAS